MGFLLFISISNVEKHHFGAVAFNKVGRTATKIAVKPNCDAHNKMCDAESVPFLGSWDPLTYTSSSPVYNTKKYKKT